MSPISDTELNAYVDGETFPERQAIIEAWLAKNPTDAERVRVWRRHNQVLRAAFGRILSEPVPSALLQASRPEATGESKITALGRSAAPLRDAPALKPQALDRRDRLALIVAGSFLTGAGVACLAGFLMG